MFTPAVGTFHLGLILLIKSDDSDGNRLISAQFFKGVFNLDPADVSIGYAL